MNTPRDYAWGSTTLIAELEGRTPTGAPEAEVWFGDHPGHPARVPDGRTLGEWLASGDAPEGTPERLPYLLKILAAGSPLSIQAHPSKAQAEEGFAREEAAGTPRDAATRTYRDANHKPEMAIALTPFEAMCGFRRLSEIAVHLRKHPEFAACISTESQLAVFTAGPRDVNAQKLALHKVFESFMACEAEESAKQLKLLVQRLRREQKAQFRPSGAQHINPASSVLSPGSATKDDDVPESAWERKAARAILRLEEQFPGDVGAMAPLFLNYLLIAPGESFFMAANEPHAYVAGEILECMACSDNVVRAGLTPKLRDAGSSSCTICSDSTSFAT